MNELRAPRGVSPQDETYKIMHDVIWKPSEEHLTRSNIARFMKKHSISGYESLIKKCSADVAWFWDAALKDLGVEWYAPYSKVVEGGLPFAKWFIDGKLNIVANCLDRHVRNDPRSTPARRQFGGIHKPRTPVPENRSPPFQPLPHPQSRCNCHGAISGWG